MRTQITNYSNKDQMNASSIDPNDPKDSFLSDSQHMDVNSSNTKRPNGMVTGVNGYLTYHKHDGINTSNYNSAKSLRISKPM
jgi:hypothetical protein